MVHHPSTATLEPVGDLTLIAQQWQELERWSDSDGFLSSAWMMPWLSMVAGRFDVRVVKASRAGRLIGMGFLVNRPLKRRLFTVQALFLNETGPSELDFCIEHNGFLLHREHQQEALSAILECLNEHHCWDELHLRRTTDASGIQGLSPHQLKRLGLRLRSDGISAAPYVDLDAVRTNGADFLSVLTSNRRAQIRRGLRKLEQYGNVELRAAQSLPQAMDFLDGLKHYHQRSWQERGEPGVFANPAWERFHRLLISGQFDSGGVQLLHIAAGDVTIGYIYSLITAGRVYMIQSGFNYELDPRSHPGECCHALAIQWNLERGYRIYDFLAGDMRYKRSLANGVTTMESVVLQRKRWRFLLEDLARALYHRLKGRSRAVSSDQAPA